MGKRFEGEEVQGSRKKRFKVQGSRFEVKEKVKKEISMKADKLELCNE
ncbi:MAG: hypothetical protein HF314_11580 [Ignavibacteria bacterium]|nr:hypothetical protein [Ignavibacteria bacterium]